MRRPGTGRGPDWLDRLEEVTADAEAVEAAVAGATGDPFTVEEVLKDHPRRLVLAATLAGAPVVVKMFRTPDAAAILAAKAAELERAAAALAGAHPPCAVAGLRLALPEAGIAVQDRAPGERFDRVLSGAGRVRRAVLLSHAGRWLRAYAGQTGERHPFAPAHWLRRAEPGLAQLDVAVRDRVKDQLGALAAAAKGKPVERAAVHGDWSPLNAFHDGEVLTGIDVQGLSNLPVALDAARFLTGMAVFVMGRPAEDGIPAEDIRAFEAGLDEVDRALALPFFIGVELVRRQVGNRGTDAGARAEAALRAWLDTPAP